jgi:hypothetical protein
MVGAQFGAVEGKLFFKLAQLFQSALTATFLFGRGAGRRQGSCETRRARSQMDAADIEIFLEAVELEKIGELERADIPPGVADFLLEITNDLGEISHGKACAVELKPEPFPVKTQGEILTGEAAIGLVKSLDLSRDR